MTVGYGRNDTDHGARNAIFAEGARHAGLNTFYGRFEAAAGRDGAPANGSLSNGPVADVKDPVLAFTIGGVHDVCNAPGSREGSVLT